jgi:thioredoxin
VVGDRPGAVCGRCQTPLPAREAGDGRGAAGPINLTDASFAAEVLGAAQPVLLDCWAAWCGPCRAVAPVIDRLATAYAGRVKVCKLDVETNPRTAESLGVQGIPALFFFKGGRVIDQMVGAHPYEAIEARLKSILARDG